MTGHQHIIEMRLDGLKPQLVFMHADEVPADWADNPYNYEVYPRVFIGQDEHVALLDLRFVAGLDIYLQAGDIPRMAEITAALRAAGAARVFSTVFDTTRQRLVYHADSETGAVWQTF